MEKIRSILWQGVDVNFLDSSRGWNRLSWTNWFWPEGKTTWAEGRDSAHGAFSFFFFSFLFSTSAWPARTQGLLGRPMWREGGVRTACQRRYAGPTWQRQPDEDGVREVTALRLGRTGVARDGPPAAVRRWLAAVRPVSARGPSLRRRDRRGEARGASPVAEGGAERGGSRAPAAMAVGVRGELRSAQGSGD